MWKRELSMNSKVSTRSAGDIVKWLGVIVLTCAGLVANYYYNELAWPLRLAGWIVLFGMLLGLALTTVRGKEFLGFVKDSRVELRKVDWPPRQETVQFTMGVVIMVVVMALALWVIDTTLLWIVKWFTG
jgi:preprotein translocase subunit SecE